ncbi:unnamed protein product [Nezara viridula]|uniref:Uncharacterized protein n=1 Tax=Nezara viridula TaxID=85310 RepID=A0A9P0MK91_NEZVI|nr:unnamed protein product [Nezara viridula]
MALTDKRWPGCFANPGKVATRGPLSLEDWLTSSPTVSLRFHPTVRSSVWHIPSPLGLLYSTGVPFDVKPPLTYKPAEYAPY